MGEPRTVDTQEIPVVAPSRPGRERAEPVVRNRRARLVARGLLVSGFVVAVVLIAGLGVLLVRKVTSTPPGSAKGPPSTVLRSSSGSLPSTTAAPSSSTSPSTTSTSTTTSLPASGPGAPRLSGVSPASGRAGAVVVVQGSGLVSSNGEVVAYVAGQPTGTNCPTRDSCDVTIPQLGAAHRTVSLTITTSGGRSNSVAFNYK
jgi:cytoskeletal protein RodZ